MKNLSIGVITRPFVNANTRGESAGVSLQLQRISGGDNDYSLISGVSLKRAIRDSMAAEGAKMWRQYNSDGRFFEYGEGKTRSMVAGLPLTLEEDYSYADSLFGRMAIPKNTEEDADPDTNATKDADSKDVSEETSEGKKKGKKGEGKKKNEAPPEVPPVRRAAFSISDAISTSPLDSSSTFHTGPKESGMAGAIYQKEHHPTRYHYILSFNLDEIIRKGWVGHFEQVLRACLSELQVGGAHATNNSTLQVEGLWWRYHNRPGAGAVHLTIAESQIFGADTFDRDPALALLEGHAYEYSTSFEFGGLCLTDTVRVGDACDRIIAQVRGL